MEHELAPRAGDGGSRPDQLEEQRPPGAGDPGAAVPAGLAFQLPTQPALAGRQRPRTDPGAGFPP